MIVAKCPLRISLVGGSTDLQKYLDEFHTGGVISFAPNLYTYIVLKKVSKGNEHNIVYSDVKEKIHYAEPHKIKNDVARAVFTHFDVPPVEIIFTADVPASGSGLASSSSYTINLIKAVIHLLGIEMSQYEICKLAVSLERTFNPLTGYQDAYGCGLGALKKLEFTARGLEAVKFLDSSVFRQMPMYLYPTHQVRSSTTILNMVNVGKINALMEDVTCLEKCIMDKQAIWDVVNRSWKKKKETSPEIVTPEVEAVENKLWLTGAKALKLLGAGGGGYFLAFYEQPQITDELQKVSIDYNGVTSIYV